MLTVALKKKIAENRKTEKKWKDNAETQRAQRFGEKKTGTKKSPAGKSAKRKSGARKHQAKRKRG
jgi:hypothetical protein